MTDSTCFQNNVNYYEFSLIELLPTILKKQYYFSEQQTFFVVEMQNTE